MNIRDTEVQCNMYITNKMHKIFVIRLYLQYTATQQPDYGTGIYQIRHTAYKKTAPEDGLIQSETCRAYTVNKV